MEDTSKITYFFLGMGLGVAVGMLFAPQSGSETRDFLASKAGEGKDYLIKRSGEFKDAAGDVLEKGKNLVSQQKDQLASAFEAGKQAYRDAISQSGGSAPEGV